MSPLRIDTISDLLNLSGQDDLRHPMLHITTVESLGLLPDAFPVDFSLGFYMIGLIRNMNGEVNCGRRSYDFQKGTMFFLSPDQLVGHALNALVGADGWLLFFHRAYLANHPLQDKVPDYGFFDYAINEALHLSQREEASMEALLENIYTEYRHPIDRYSRNVVIANLELIINYADRYYGRQFVTRQEIEGSFLVAFNDLLSGYFRDDRLEDNGIPTVPQLAAALHMSPKYLSEKLKNETGKTAQEHVQLKLVEHAKVLLRQDEITIAEVAYQLGFQYPQYFSRFFKQKVGVSPKAFQAMA